MAKLQTEFKVKSKYSEGDTVNITLKDKTDRQATVKRVVSLSSSLRLPYVVHTWEGAKSREAYMLLETFEKCERRHNRLHK